MKSSKILHALVVLFLAFSNIAFSKSAAPELPNIVLVLTDDQTFESLPAMPFVSSQGWFSFTNTFTNVALCCPARATILSGKYSHKSGVETNHLGFLHNETSDIAARLNGAGYETAYFGKYLNGYPWGRGLYVPPGWDKWSIFLRLTRTTRYYYDYSMVEKNLAETVYGSRSGDYSTTVLAKKAIEFIKTAQTPFSLFLAVFAPHTPYIPAPRHLNADVGVAKRYPNYNEDDVSDKPAWVQALPRRDSQAVDKIRLDQYRALLAVDEAVEKIVRALKRRGIYRNTVIIFMSDNGYAIGEHRHIGKICEYDECLRIPLLIHLPKFADREIPQLVSNVDIAPTIADLAGIPQDGFDGSSLIPLMIDTNIPWREEILFRWAGDPLEVKIPPFWGVRTALWKYVELETGERELYDLINDPYEMNNRYGKPGYEAVIQDLQIRLENIKK